MRYNNKSYYLKRISKFKLIYDILKLDMPSYNFLAKLEYCHLYHGENKSLENKIMMMYLLY